MSKWRWVVIGLVVVVVVVGVVVALKRPGRGRAQEATPAARGPESAQAPGPAPAPRPELVLQIGHAVGVTALAFSPDGKTLASGGDAGDSTVKLWAAETGWLKRTLRGHTKSVVSLAFSADGKTLASRSDEGKVKVWDVETGQPTPTGKGWQASLPSARPSPDYEPAPELRSPDGTILARTSGEVVELRDTKSGRLKHRLKGHTDWVASLAFSPDGRTLASGSGMPEGIGDVPSTWFFPEIILWDVDTGKAKHTLEGYDSKVYALDISPDGKTVACGVDDSTVMLWDLRTGELKRTLKGHDCPLDSVAFSPDGKTLASGGGMSAHSGEIMLWDAETGKMLSSYSALGPPYVFVAFSPDGKTLACGGSAGQPVSLMTERRKSPVGIEIDEGSQVFALAFSPDGRLLAVGVDDTVNLCDPTTGKVKTTLRGHTDLVWDVAFSPNGKIVATASDDGTLKLWDTASGALMHTLKGHGGSATSVAFSPNGTIVASGGGDGTVILWNPRTGRQKMRLRGDEGRVLGVDFSAGGNLLAGSAGGTVKLWEAASGRLLASLVILQFTKEREPSPEWIAFTPEGYYTGSPRGKQFIHWRVGDQLFPAEAYEKQFHRPDLVQKALRGESVGQ